MKKEVITLTKDAVDKIKVLLAKRAKTSLGVRISIKQGGCSGLSYVVEYADDYRQFEEVVEIDDIKIFIDPKALMYIIGSEMDYIEEKFQAGFVFNNPNKRASCGCGKSFKV